MRACLRSGTAPCGARKQRSASPKASMCPATATGSCDRPGMPTPPRKRVLIGLLIFELIEMHPQFSMTE